MNKSLNVVLASLLAGGASLAVAQSSAAMPAPATEAQQFTSELRTLDHESSPMWIPNVHVDRNARAADPVPKATTLAQREAWSSEETQLLQQESRGAPTVSVPVNKHEPAADPVPKATTYPQKVAAFASEERFLQRQATP